MRPGRRLVHEPDSPCRAAGTPPAPFRQGDTRRKQNMSLRKPKIRSRAAGLLIAAFALLFSGAYAQDCERGQLDAMFCDVDGDLVADAPTDPAAFIDPDVLVFAYTPVEDPA